MGGGHHNDWNTRLDRKTTPSGQSGIRDVTADTYHADNLADVPTLSASIAHILISQSPAHARAAHPKLNPQLVREETDRFDIGTCAHSILLQGDDLIHEVDAPDWRTKLAKEEREAARAAGRVPLLVRHAESVRDMVAAARAQLDVHEAAPPLFTDGKPEQTIIWEDAHGVVCRARLDWLRDDLATIDDYKTTSASADPDRWARTMYGIGGDVQVAFYLRGVEALTGGQPAWRYVVQETSPPYLLSVVDLAPSALALAVAKVEMAVTVWARCLESGEWPGYPSRVASIDAPTWEETRWYEREDREAAAA